MLGVLVLYLLFFSLPLHYTRLAAKIFHPLERTTRSHQGYALPVETLPLPELVHSPAQRWPLPLSMTIDDGNLSFAWRKYVISRCGEWKFIAAMAVTISISLLQVLESNNNIIFLSFILLAILRAVAAIGYASTLLYFFAKHSFQTGHFAIAWYRVAKDQKSLIFNLWTMVALPAVALCWSVIFLIIALFCLMWNIGDSSQSSAARSLFVTCIRVLTTSASIGDMLIIVWTSSKLAVIGNMNLNNIVTPDAEDRD